MICAARATTGSETHQYAWFSLRPLRLCGRLLPSPRPPLLLCDLCVKSFQIPAAKLPYEPARKAALSSWRTLRPRNKPRIIKNPRDSLPVMNLAAPYPIQSLAQRKNPRRNLLIHLRIRRPRLQPLRQKYHHLLAQKSRTRINPNQLPHRPRRIPSLLLQLPMRPTRERLLPIAPPRHQLPKKRSDAMPVLPYQKYAPVGKYRQHHYRPRVLDKIPRSLNALRLRHQFPPHIKNAAAENNLAAQYLPKRLQLRCSRHASPPIKLARQS